MPSPKHTTNVGIQVGTSPDAIEAARSAIVGIISVSGLDQKTIRAALSAFTDVAKSPSNVTIAGATITMPPG